MPTPVSDDSQPQQFNGAGWIYKQFLFSWPLRLPAHAMHEHWPPPPSEWYIVRGWTILRSQRMVWYSISGPGIARTASVGRRSGGGAGYALFRHRYSATVDNPLSSNEASLLLLPHRSLFRVEMYSGDLAFFKYQSSSIYALSSNRSTKPFFNNLRMAGRKHPSLNTWQT